MSKPRHRTYEFLNDDLSVNAAGVMERAVKKARYEYGFKVRSWREEMSRALRNAWADAKSLSDSLRRAAEADRLRRTNPALLELQAARTSAFLTLETMSFATPAERKAAAERLARAEAAAAVPHLIAAE